MIKLLRPSISSYLKQEGYNIFDSFNDKSNDTLLSFYLCDGDFKIKIIEIECNESHNRRYREYIGQFNAFDLTEFNVMLRTKKIKKYYFIQITYEYFYGSGNHYQRCNNRYSYGKIHVFRYYESAPPDNDKYFVLYDQIGENQGGGTGEEIHVCNKLDLIHLNLKLGYFDIEYDKFNDVINLKFPDLMNNYEIRSMHLKELVSEEMEYINKYIIGFADNKILCAIPTANNTPSEAKPVKNMLIKKLIDETKIILDFDSKISNQNIIIKL
jgi:hypothetical protein